MQINDGHQCDLQQPEDISPAKQKLSGKAEEQVEVENVRCGHQHKQFTVRAKLAAQEEINKRGSANSVN